MLCYVTCTLLYVKLFFVMPCYVMLLELRTPLTYLWLSLSAFLLPFCLDLFPSQNFPCARPNKGEANSEINKPKDLLNLTQEKDSTQSQICKQV